MQTSLSYSRFTAYCFLTLFLLVSLCKSEDSDVPMAIKFPLTTEGPTVVSANGYKVYFNCINWTGADMKDYVLTGLGNQTLDNVAKIIKKGGFNCIRYPFSLELLRKNPVLLDSVVAAEPKLKGKTAMYVLKYTVNRLTRKHGLMVIMDNHVSDAVWCCFPDDKNGLWFTDHYSEKDWIDYWVEMARIFKPNPRVIGFELRNELRPAVVNGTKYVPSWNTLDEKVDFSRAAKLVSEAIHKVNPDALIFVETAQYSHTLEDAAKKPLILHHSNKVVYTIHEYIWFHPEVNFEKLFQIYKKNPNDNELKKAHKKFNHSLDQRFGDFAKSHPVWLSEIGRDNSQSETISSSNDLYWHWLMSYIKQHELVGFAYWRLDSFYSSSPKTKYGSVERYALMNKDWTDFSNKNLLKSLKGISQAIMYPGPAV